MTKSELDDFMKIHAPKETIFYPRKTEPVMKKKDIKILKYNGSMAQHSGLVKYKDSYFVMFWDKEDKLEFWKSIDFKTFEEALFLFNSYMDQVHPSDVLSETFKSFVLKEGKNGRSI